MSKVAYKPLNKFQQRPIRVLLDDVWIGIGSVVTTRDGKKSWPEATQEQYDKLGELGRLDLVRRTMQGEPSKVTSKKTSKATEKTSKAKDETEQK